LSGIGGLQAGDINKLHLLKSGGKKPEEQSPDSPVVTNLKFDNAN